MIGEGGSNSMGFLAKWKKREVAFKCFKTRTLLSDQDVFTEFEQEVKIGRSLSHPHIIQFFGASLKPPRIGIVMEYCENGTILEFIKNFREENMKGYPLHEKMRMIGEIVSAMDYIHSRSIIHRDLKAENILINKEERCKLMDFGISRVVEKSSTTQKTKRIGTNVYMAPEILVGAYDEKCDVFSFGILLFVLFTEKDDPYDGKFVDIEFRVAQNPQFRPNLDELPKVLNSRKYQWIKTVMVKCWSERSNERYSFSEMIDIFENRNVVNVVTEDGGGLDSSEKNAVERKESTVDVEKVCQEILYLKRYFEETKSKEIECVQCKKMMDLKKMSIFQEDFTKKLKDL